MSFKLLALVFLSLVFLSACDSKTNDNQTTTAENESLPPLKPLLLSMSTKNACDTAVDRLERIGVNHDAKLKDVVTNASNPSHCAEMLALQIVDYFREQSNDLVRRGNLAEQKYNMVVVGGGPHGSIFSRNFTKTSSKRILLIDAEAVFSRHFRSKLYRVNIPERRIGNMGFPFPSMPIQLRDFAENKLDADYFFPLAMELWSQIAFTLFLSNIDFLIDRVEAIKHADEYAEKPSLQLLLKSDTLVTAKNVVLSTGLGEPTAKINKEFLTWLNSNRKTNINSVPIAMYVDDFLDLAENQRHDGIDTFEQLVGKKIAVLGAHASGSVMRNYLEGLAPSAAYLRQNPQRPRKIFIFGTGGEIDKGGIVKHYNVKVSNVTLDPQSANATLSFNELGFDESVVVDHVFVAGGYKSTLKTILAPIIKNADIAKEVVYAPIPGVNEEQQVVANKITINGTPFPIFMIGGANGEIFISSGAYHAAGLGMKLGGAR